MNVNFIFPFKDKNGCEKVAPNKIGYKINEKYSVSFNNEGVKWMVANYPVKKIIIVIGTIDSKQWYWCNSIPFEGIYKKYPLIRSDRNRFDKKGFNKVILESIINVLGIKKSLEDINKESFKKYVLETFEMKL